MPDSAAHYRRPWWLGFIVFIIVLSVDVKLLSPWVSWELESQDSGDLICSAYFLGIPHPTGYPTYCMLAKLVQTIVPIKSIAWRTNLFSALSAAVCCAVVALTMHRLLWSAGQSNKKREPWVEWAIAATVGLGLGFSRTFLSQSVISEVYVLNAAFVALDITLIVEIFCAVHENRPVGHIRRNLATLSVIYGITLTNHLSSAFIFPLVLAGFVSAYKTLNIKFILRCLLYFIIGLTPYLYLPIRSAANPPFDWGNPQTLGNFIWVITGSQFKHLMFASFDYQVIHRLFSKFEPMLELGPVFALTVLWGASTVARGGLLSRVALIAVALMVLNLLPVMNYHIADTQSFLLPTFIGTAMLLGLGLYAVLKKSTRFKSLPAILLSALILVSLPSYVMNIRHDDLSRNLRPKEYAERVYNELPDKAILVETFYARAFTMWYEQFIETGNRKHIAVIYAEHLRFDWGVENLKRLYPWVIFPEADPDEGEAIAAFVDGNFSSVPVFLSREVPSLKGKYEFMPFGEIFQLKQVENSR